MSLATAAMTMGKPVLGVATSLSGKAWRWRGAGTQISGDAPGFEEDITAQLLLARGVERAELARHRRPLLRDFLPDPAIFKDMEKASARIAQAVQRAEQVTIYGDYDVDGATSAALLVRLLRALGLAPQTYIPDRLLEGYGPSGPALRRIGENGTSLIITVDCGAMAFEALAEAAAAGIEVIVVDHHKCAPELPPAYALINPNRLDESPEAAQYGHLAAVGVAFLLGVDLVRRLRRQGFFNHRPEPDLLALLDLVALGTVADVAALRGLNRAFVAQGLKVMARRGNPGLAALCDASRLKRAPRSQDCGFALGPRINAAGRIGDSGLGVRLLTTEDPAEAARIAATLSQLNEERRAIEAQVQEEAEAQLAGQRDAMVHCVAGQGWHPGVIGIVAGRIKEKTGRPAIVIAIDPNTGVGKGSGRSIAGVDLGAAIIGARDAGLLLAGGGHAMAAGLTLPPAGLEPFRAWLERQLESVVRRAMESDSLLLDLVVAPRGLSPGLVETLEAAGPFGMGWPGPRLAVGPVRVVRADVVGTDHLRLIAAGSDGASFKAVAFRAAHSPFGQALLRAADGQRLWLAGRARLDDWAARPAAELHLEDAALAA